MFVYYTRKDGEETEAERLQMEDNMYALSMCRVLHIGASKVARSKSNGFFNTTYIHTCMPDYHHKVVLVLQYYKHSIISIVRYIENASFLLIRNDYLLVDDSSLASLKLPSKSKCKELKLLSKAGKELAEKKSASLYYNDNKLLYVCMYVHTFCLHL